MHFRLLHGQYSQANQDGLEGKSLKVLREMAIKQKSEIDLTTATKLDIIAALRNGAPAEIVHQATKEHKPTFEESNPDALHVLRQDPGKYQSLEGEIDQLGQLGPITAEELARRGLADVGYPDAKADDLENMTVADLRKMAEAEEIELTDDNGKAISTKADIVATIRRAVKMTPA